MLGRGVRVVRRRAVVGTAVGVAATAGMVSGARRNRAERQAIEQQTQNQNNTTEDPQPAPASDELTQKLTELTDLKNKGLITQEEFEAKKKQLLNL